MYPKKKGRQMGDPVPNSVCHDKPEYNPELLSYQARHLAATFGMLPDTASTVATLAFYGVLRA